MSDGWQIVSNIASICSIIALPIALYQIWKIRSTTMAMQKAIYNFLSLEKIATLNKIFDTLTNLKNLLVSTYNKTTKKGTSIGKIKAECEEFIKEINACVNNLPTEFSDIEILLVESAKYLNEYIENGDSIKIKDCDSNLRRAIFGLKKIKEASRKFEIQTISRGN